MLRNHLHLNVLAGGLASGMTHLLDVAEASIRLRPETVLGVGSLMFVLLTAMPAMSAGRSALIDEMVAVRDFVLEHLFVLLEEDPPLVGAFMLAELIVKTLDRGIAGKRVKAKQLTRIIVELQQLNGYRLAVTGKDPYHAERQRALALFERWRTELLDQEADAAYRDANIALLRQRRQAAQLTLAQLGEQVGVSARTVIRWEHGETEPARSQRQKLAELLGGRPSDYEER